MLGDSCWAWEMSLPAAEQAPALARQATREVLASWRVAHLEETPLLFVSELVTNAVRHAACGGSMLILRLEGPAPPCGSRSTTRTRSGRSRARRTGSMNQDTVS